MASLAFFELENWEEKIVKQRLAGHKLQFFSRPLSKSNVNKVRNVNGIAVFIYSKVTEALLQKLPKLKFIATMSTGFDHVDLAACRKRGIIVSNVPYYGENTVAEHTFALILAFSRKLIESAERTRRGNFSPHGLCGFDIKGKTIGVIGTGHIGMHVLRMARGFEMRMLAYDVKKDVAGSKRLGFKYVSLDTLLKKSDFVTLHCPYNKQTHHMINNNNIRKMKKDAYLINTARGGLVETEALLNALNSGRLAGAGIDVLEEESAIKEEKQLLAKRFIPNLRTVLENHILLGNENVIITPHNAFNSIEALNRILNTTIDNVSAYLRKKPVNIVK
ncbi:hydroxyacid dehydrogenase [Candidatus Woesearchaeota archaeon]|nr:hydroxyacid dehydrogenase [Candidatus Woesearchaeota archaeon]